MFKLSEIVFLVILNSLEIKYPSTDIFGVLKFPQKQQPATVLKT